jgi:hypothetical protein
LEHWGRKRKHLFLLRYGKNARKALPHESTLGGLVQMVNMVQGWNHYRHPKGWLGKSDSRCHSKWYWKLDLSLKLINEFKVGKTADNLPTDIPQHAVELTSTRIESTVDWDNDSVGGVGENIAI